MTSKAELVRTNLVHATEKHRGIDGRMRLLCGLELVLCRVQDQPILFQPNDRNKSRKYSMYGNGGKCGAALMFLIYHAKNREEEVVDPCMD